MASNSNKNKKYGRKKSSGANAAYKASGRKRSNKLKRLAAYCSNNPNDEQAAKSYNRILKDTTWGYRK